MTTPGATPARDARRAGALFWVLVALFVALIAGTVDIAVRLWRRDDALVAAGMAVTAAVLAWWLARCLRGWWAARAGETGMLASRGGAAWSAGIAALVIANLAAGAVLVSLAADESLASPDRVSAGVDLLTVASNVWVVLYYRVPRAWNGRRPGHRPS